MINIFPLIFTFIIFFLSLSYLKFFKAFMAQENFNSNGIISKFKFAILKTISSSIQLYGLRAKNVQTIPQSINSVMLIFTSLLSVYLGLVLKDLSNHSDFWIFSVVLLVSLFFFTNLVIGYCKILDLDTFILATGINYLLILLMFISTTNFNLSNPFYENMFNILFGLMSIKIITKLFPIVRTKRKVLYLEHMYFVWLVGSVYLILSFYVNKIDIYSFDLKYSLEVFVFLLLSSLIMISQKQHAKLTEKVNLDKIISFDVAIILIAIIARGIFWRQ